MDDPTRSVPTGPTSSDLAFQGLRAVADAVLYEGYLLYPYRRSSPKNRVRWQFGVLTAQRWAERDGEVPPGISGSADSWYQQTECLLRAVPAARVRLRVRYLQLQRKQVEERTPDGRHRPVESIETADAVHLTFDEAVPREAEFAIPLAQLLQRDHRVSVGAPADEETETLAAGVGRVTRRRDRVHAVTRVRAEQLQDPATGTPDAGALYRLRVRIENVGSSPDATASREEALRHALMATHTMIGGDGVEFLSLIEPPREYEEYAGACRNLYTFPVLGGAAGSRDAMLSSPIILSDHPQVAPESPGDLHDAAEIDEILTLRTLLLTDEEKREARATDRRAAEILDRVETMPPEVFARLHGAIRSLSPAPPLRPPTAAVGEAVDLPARPALVAVGEAVDLPARPALVAVGEAVDPYARPATAAVGDVVGIGTRTSVPWWQEGGDDGLSPSTDSVLVDGVPVVGGSAVRLRPAGRGADAQDMFLAGRTARVEAVFHDVDGSVHVAVALDDDPAAELNSWYGRFLYFRPHELQPLTAAADEGGCDGRP